MSTELRPGVISAKFASLSAKVQGPALAAGMTALALAVERQTKDDLGKASHPYGTRTTASPGGPPAIISGTLRRSITHSNPEVSAAGVSIKVGPAAGFFPHYPGHHKKVTPSSRYGFYNETGLRNGATYPFLGPAFRKVTTEGDVVRALALFIAELSL